MFWRVVMWPLSSGAYFSITVANASICSGVTPPSGSLHADHLDVGLALAVDALLEAEADELSSVWLAAQELRGLGVEVVELALEDRDHVSRHVLVDLGVLERAELALAVPWPLRAGLRRACARRRRGRAPKPRMCRSAPWVTQNTQILTGFRAFSPRGPPGGGWAPITTATQLLPAKLASRRAGGGACPPPANRGRRSDGRAQRLSRRRCPRSGTRRGRGRGTRRGCRRGSRC